MAKMALILLVLNFTAAVLGTSLGNELTYSRTPVPGQPFTITWNPANYAVIDLLLWSLSGYPEYVPTTSDTIAIDIDNSGSYVWNVPSTLKGYFTIGTARDFNFPLAYGPQFAIGGVGPFSTVSYAKSIPQATACTSAIPSATGINPFILPDRSSGFRAGVPTELTWQPTTGGTVTLVLNYPDGDYDLIVSATIARNISNSGSYSWAPTYDSILTKYGGWSFDLIDDGSQAVSSSESFNIKSVDEPSDFTGPYSIPVIGQDHTFYWSPSTSPTVSIILVSDVPYSTENVTIADHIQNTGEWTWSIPSRDDTIIAGVWYFDLVDDATGVTDSKVQLTIDASTPTLCPAPTQNAFSSYLSSMSSLKAKTSTPHATTTSTKIPVTTGSAYSLLLSFSSLVASESSAREATITRLTPVVTMASTSALFLTSSASLIPTGSGSGVAQSTVSAGASSTSTTGANGTTSGQERLADRGVLGMVVALAGLALGSLAIL